VEDQPLGTMGPLRLITDLPEHFLVMNGDILTDLDYTQFHDSHVSEDRIFTISSMRREHWIDYGVLDTDNSGLLTGFREKPSMAYEVSMGVYMVSAHALQCIPVGGPYGFDSLMLDLLKAQSPATVQSFSGYWLDIGRPDDYAIAIDVFERDRSRFL
jgi:NDP-sugar pyrophosphorylase family protein